MKDVDAPQHLGQVFEVFFLLKLILYANAYETVQRQVKSDSHKISEIDPLGFIVPLTTITIDKNTLICYNKILSVAIQRLKSESKLRPTERSSLRE